MSNFTRVKQIILSVAIPVVAFSLLGTPVHARVAANLTTVAFPNQLVGTSSAPINITLTNSGRRPTTIVSAAVSLAQFSFSGLSLPVALDSGQSVTVAVTFLPDGVQTYSDTLAITNSFGSITVVALTGTGVQTQTADQAPAITSAGNTTFAVGAAASFTITATGAPAPTLSESGALPTGVQFNPTTGILSGTPAAGTDGTYPVILTADNGIGTDAEQSFTLTVNGTLAAPAITSANNVAFTVGLPGSFAVTATGAPTPTLSEDGTLPAGVTFTSSSGVLSGTPAVGTAGTYPLTITAHASAGGSAPNVFIQEIDQEPGGIATSSLPIAFNSNVSAADLLLCTVGWETANGSLISSVTDSLGNAFSALPLVVHPPHQMQAFYAFSNGSGADTVTVQFDGAGGTYIGLACGEWSGPTHLDLHSEAFGTGTTPTSAALTPSASGELLIGYADDSINNWTAVTPWTLRSLPTNARYGLEDQLSSATDPISSGFTILSAPWSAGIAAFTSANDAVQNFALTVNPGLSAPAITMQPVSQSTTVGGTATFSVAAIGTAPMTFQWQKNGNAIAGATSSTYTTPSTATSDTGAQFAVTVTNSVGSVTSSNATLTVNTTAVLLNSNSSVLNFGSVNVSTTANQEVTLTNAGNSNVSVSNVSVSGAGFSASGVSTGLTLSPGQTTTLNVTFTPSAAGNVTGSVTVASTASNSPDQIALSGTGVAAAAHSVVLTWTPSTSVVVGYNTYSSAVSGGPYTKLTTAPVVAITYTDNSVLSGQTYYYVVTSVDSNNVESVYSNEVPAVVPQ